MVDSMRKVHDFSSPAQLDNEDALLGTNYDFVFRSLSFLFLINTILAIQKQFNTVLLEH